MEQQTTEKTYYISREQYLTIKASWAAKPSHAAWEHIIYNILRNKPANCGFTEKTKNIQGNDPWYGFNGALSKAKRMVPGQTCPWAVGTSSHSRWEEAMKAHAAETKAIFGIDLPEDILLRLEESV